MNLLITEAAVLGGREALKLVVVWYVLRAFLSDRGRTDLLRPFVAAIALVSVAALGMAFVEPSPMVRGALARGAGYVFFLAYLGSVGALYQTTGVTLVPRNSRGAALLGPVIFVLGAAYFLPDMAASVMYLGELAAMREAPVGAYVWAAAGFAATGAALGGLLVRLRPRVGRFFETPQLLLFLAVLKLVAGGGIGGVELSLIPTVQRGAMKFVHDAVHQTFVFLLVPDHPVLSTTTWNFVGVLFGPNAGLGLGLFLLLAPPVLFLARIAAMPLDSAAPSGSAGAERRLRMAEVRADRIRKALPVAFFIAVILASWFASSGESLSRLYLPAPKPVVADKGLVVIPLSDPTMDLADGRLHKFALSLGGETVRLLVIRKPGGKLAVCLDACEVCPPEGYGQDGDHVTCVYCMTPIPIDTLGRPGGCNPVPVPAEISPGDIRIRIEDIDRLWRDVKAKAIAATEEGE
jgi:hypothetical protein